MTDFVNSTQSMKERMDSFFEKYGNIPLMIETKHGLDDLVTLSLEYIDKDGNIVDRYPIDFKPTEDMKKIILIS